jgi:hypothetical protein
MNTNTFALNEYSKGLYLLPSLEKPIDFYANYKYYSKLYLKNGIELWNSNIIKTQIIPSLKLNKIELYYMNKNYADMNEEDKRLARQNQALISQFNLSLSELDVPNILMGIAVERILKGFLLNNGYIIHAHQGVNRLTHISDKPGVYAKLTDEVYSLSEFTKHNVLKATLPWETDEELIITLKNIQHLKILRDNGVHLVAIVRIFQVYDLILYKSVNNLMKKAMEFMKDQV